MMTLSRVKGSGEGVRGSSPSVCVCVCVQARSYVVSSLPGNPLLVWKGVGLNR